MDTRGSVKKNYWVFALIIIFIASLYIRCIPGTKLVYPQLLEIDTHYVLRLSEYIVEHGYLPEHDSIAGWGTVPGGPDRNKEQIITLWAYPIVYFILNPFFGVSVYWVGVWAPAFFGALQVLFMYFLGKELFNDRRIGLLSAAFLAFAPGILYRVSAGWMEKEAVAGIFIVLGFYFFVKSFKEQTVNKETSWRHLITHPFSLLDRVKLDAEKIKAVKTVAYGITSGFFFTLLAGSSGQIRISTLMIMAFVMVSLLLNRYSKRLFYSYIATFISYFIMSRVFAASPGITDIDNIANYVAVGFIVIRYLIEKFEVIEKKYMPYVMPALAAVGIFAVIILSYVFVDFGAYLAGTLDRIANPLTQGVIPSTVAESQSVGHFLYDSVSNFGTGYAVSAFEWPQFMIYFSAMYFSVFGIALMCYEFIFKKHDLEFILVAAMYVSGIILAIGAARLAFQFAFPFAIATGYCLIRGGSYALNAGKKALKDKGYRYLKVTGGVLIGLILLTNFAAAWVMANGISTPMTDDFYQAMIWLRDNTPEDAVLLEWWDYGWWYQYIAKKITLVDGGYHDRRPTQDVAKFFTEPLSETPDSYSSLNFLKNYTIDYVMVSSDLIPKFGAMSKIANWGEKIDVLPVLNLNKNYQEGDKILLEYGGGEQTILVAYSVGSEGNETFVQNMTALVKTSQGQAYLKKIGVGNQILVSDRPNTIPGLLYFAGNAVIYVPEAVENCVFVRLYLFDGAGMENYFEKVYDKLGIKIYKVKYENFPTNITGGYIDAVDR
jgi:dolichyl-diphosphooligosaccharide--protein glycosyltransferase